MWYHEDTDGLSDLETSNSTNYSTTIDLPDSYVSAHSAGFSSFNAEDNAINHTGYAESNGRPNNTSSVKSPNSTNSNANGPYVTQNGTRSKITDCATTTNPTIFAQHYKKAEQAFVTKPVSPRTCPIHQHNNPRERHGAHQSGKSGCDAVLSKESLRVLGK